MVVTFIGHGVPFGKSYSCFLSKPKPKRDILTVSTTENYFTPPTELTFAGHPATPRATLLAPTASYASAQQKTTTPETISVLYQPIVPRHAPTRTKPGKQMAAASNRESGNPNAFAT